MNPKSQSPGARRPLVPILALVLLPSLTLPGSLAAQAGASYSVVPGQLTATVGATSDNAVVQVNLPSPLGGNSAVTQSFHAQIPAQLTGLVTMLPASVALTLQPGAQTAQSAPFRFSVAPGTPSGSYTLPIVREGGSGAGMLVVGPTTVTRLRLTVKPAPVAVQVMAVGAYALKLRPAEVAVAPGETSPPVDVELDFPIEVVALGGTVDVALPPQLAGNTQAIPTPLTFSIGGSANKVHMTLRIATTAQTPLGRWNIQLSRNDPDFGSAHATLVLDVRSRGDFALSFEPASLALCAGGAGSRGVLRLTGANGYRGRPRLSWSALPAGITALPAALPAVQLPPDAAVPFELHASGSGAKSVAVTATAADATLGVQRSATLQVDVGQPGIAPSAGPAPIAVAQSAPARAFQLALKPNTCLSAASVRVTLSGAPAGLLVTGFPGSFVAPAYAPLAFTLRALPQLAVGTYPLIATFAGPGLAPVQLTIPVEVQAPGRAELLLAPAIDIVEPNQVQRGQQIDLHVVGRNLKAGTQLSFGAGIQVVGQPLFTSDYDGDVKVYVGPLAPFGLHAVVAQNERGSSNGPGGLLVEAPFLALAPRIDTVEPPQVAPGKSYLVKLTGANLSPTTAVDLGPGIQVLGQLLPAGAGTFAAKIAVAADAPSGSRLARASTQAGSNQGPGAITVGSGLPAVQAVMPVTPQFPHGTIFLEFPEWGTKDMSNFQAGYKMELGVPAITDALKFEWREQNPGTADYYELRVLDAKGDKVITTRRIEPGMTIGGVVYPTLPDFYRPDPAFIQELAAALPSGVAQLGATPQSVVANPSAAAKAALGGSQPSGPTAQLNQTLVGLQPDPLEAAGHRDFLWEVAGFWLPQKSGATSGASAQGGQKLSPQGALGVQNVALVPVGSAPPQGLEVEISERWPLRFSTRPTGLACPAAGKQAGIHSDNLDSPDQNTYVDDRIRLDGTISLDGSPYAANPKGIPDPMQQFADAYASWQQMVEDAMSQMSGPFGGGSSSSSSSGGGQPQLNFYDLYQFDNVLIDWGDGTVEPLIAKTDNKTLYWSSYQTLTLLPGDAAPTHQYQHPGTYTVRIYQLADADLQNIDPAQLAFAVDGYPGDPLMQLAALHGRSPGSPPAPWLSGAASSSGQQIAARAYMLYCSSVLVVPRVDPCARGRLRLVSIDIVGFPGHDVQDASTGKAVQAPGSLDATATPILPGASAPAAGAARRAAPTKSDLQVQAKDKTVVSTLKTSVDGVATDCDEAMTARARLSYFGRGKAVVRFRWEDGTVFYTSPVLDLASAPRTDLGQDPSQWGDPQISTIDVDAPLSVDLLGIHGISVEAEVIFDPLSSLLGALLGADGGQGGATCPNVDVETSQVIFPFDDKNLVAGAKTPPGGNATFKVGALLPSAVTGGSGGGQVVAPIGALGPAGGGSPPMGALGPAQALKPHASGKKSPPDFVQSPTRSYQVVAADPNKPCFFLFPTDQGIFRVTDVNGHVVAEGNGRFSGQGLLKFPLTAGSDSYTETPLDVGFQNWLSNDSQTVDEGTLAISPHQDVSAPGMRARIDKVDGIAKQSMKATLDVRPVQQSLVQPAQSWSSQQPITDQGNWIAEGMSLADSAIGNSGFSIESNAVALDLSRDAGPGSVSSYCGNGGPSFVGIHLGNATLHSYDFGIGGMTNSVPNWAIEDSGLCGSAQLSGLPQHSLGDGWLKIGSIDARAIGGGFSATYKGFQVFSPWFGKPLGPVDLKMFDSGGSSYGFSLPGLGDADLQDWGTVSMKASQIELVREQSVGWALHGATLFQFKTLDDKFFGQVDTDRLFFRLADSTVYFQGGKTSTEIALKGVAQPAAPHLGKAGIELLKVNLFGGSGQSEPLRFDFRHTLKLSSAAELDDPEIDTGFAIAKQGSGFAADGPNTAPFTGHVAFPIGNPQVEGTVTPSYQYGSTRFCGGLNLGLLGGSGLGGGNALFLLLYDEQTGEDGWLAQYEVPVAGGTGMPIAPPLPINLFKIEGGLAYNLAKADQSPQKSSPPFSDPISCNSPLDIQKTGPLFAAGVEAGTTDHQTVTVRGMFSVSKTYGARLDVDAWLLRSDHSGPGDIQGVLKWQNSAFQGKFWGGYKFLQEPFFNSGYAVSLDLGSSESAAAVDLLFASNGDWHVKAGDQYGTPITGRVLFATSKAWLGISGNGLSNLELKAGGKQEIGVHGKIWKCNADAGAKFSCGVDMGINPLKIGGSADASFGVSLCGVGFSLGGHVAMGCCAPYADVQLCADIKPCWDGWHPALCEVCGGFSL